MLYQYIPFREAHKDAIDVNTIDIHTVYLDGKHA